MRNQIDRLLRELDREGILDEYLKSKKQLWDPRNTITLLYRIQDRDVAYFRRVHWNNLELLSLSHTKMVQGTNFPCVWGVVVEKWEPREIHTYGQFEEGFVGLSLGYFPEPDLNVFLCTDDLDSRWNGYGGVTQPYLNEAKANTLGCSLVYVGGPAPANHTGNLEDFKNNIDQIPITTWENLWETPTNTSEIKFDL